MLMSGYRLIGISRGISQNFICGHENFAVRNPIWRQFFKYSPFSEDSQSPLSLPLKQTFDLPNLLRCLLFR